MQLLESKTVIIIKIFKLCTQKKKLDNGAVKLLNIPLEISQN
jgi:hypothetical protein